MKSSRFLLSVVVAALVFGLIDFVCYRYIGKVYSLGFLFRSSLPFHGMIFYLFLALGMYTYGRVAPFRFKKALEAVNMIFYGLWMYATLQWVNAPTWTVFIQSNVFWLSIAWGGALCLVTWMITELLMLTVKNKI